MVTLTENDGPMAVARIGPLLLFHLTSTGPGANLWPLNTVVLPAGPEAGLTLEKA